MTRALRMSLEQYEQAQRRTKGGDRLAGTNKVSDHNAVTGGDASAKRARGMNKWEREYAELLTYKRLAGEILFWGFEHFKLRLATGAWYKPDFAVVQMRNGQAALHFEEVKGYRREASIVRIKVASELYPFPFWLITRKDGNWVRTRI
jgi:hypothetical protein